MKAVFVELPAFTRFRAEYLDDDGLRRLQLALMRDPSAGALIRDAGGLRKVRHADSRRGKGKRGGLRVIYYWWEGGSQFWLFTIYDKSEKDDLTPAERRALKERVKLELAARSKR